MSNKTNDDLNSSSSSAFDDESTDSEETTNVAHNVEENNPEDEENAEVEDEENAEVEDEENVEEEEDNADIVEEEIEEENVEEEENEEQDLENEEEDYDIETVKDTDIDKSVKACIYKKKNNGSSSDSEYEDDVFEYIDIAETVSNKLVAPENRITKPILTKYERVRLLSDRTTQLTRGAKPLVKNIDGLSSKEIAEIELKFDKIPLKIKRPLPNGTYEIWYTSELMHDRL